MTETAQHHPECGVQTLAEWAEDADANPPPASIADQQIFACHPDCPRFQAAASFASTLWPSLGNYSTRDRIDAEVWAEMLSPEDIKGHYEQSPAREQREMQAILTAGHRVRGGYMNWLKGAPTHVLADLLNELAIDGWTLAEREQLDNEANATMIAENALRAITTAGDGGAWAEVYQAAGGGYEGLQAIADRARTVIEQIRS